MQSSIQPLQRLSFSSCYAFSYVYLPRSIRLLSTKGPTPVSRNSQLTTMPSPAQSSSPSTPSSQTPSDRSCWRFNNIYEPTEWVEAYRPTGYHPVHFGDLLHDGQYKIIRKLGYGAFSTVWLARDTRYDSPLFIFSSLCRPFLWLHIQ